MKKILVLLGLLLLTGVLPTRAPPEKIEFIEISDYPVNSKLDSINNTVDELNELLKQLANKQIKQSTI
ncbi:hypothetical protein HDE69_001394 [Pedobacter cryoconitis]|uniref:Uncharacterized protein n=1 Tax=Pedobacter cryoconitis TaxID=188932 RepID=A0A7W8YRC3_9SPHI|nr:hypothetical protein [Pedobacter cryoconitis]MBB5620345.1 hypothetical protein [Pedobacter cryoconitis]MBB5647155.1 hypothetical protein [Pedobacter cryoconitis]